MGNGEMGSGEMGNGEVDRRKCSPFPFLLPLMKSQQSITAINNTVLVKV